jgi:hypothetical protein
MGTEESTEPPVQLKAGLETTRMSLNPEQASILALLAREHDAQDAKAAEAADLLVRVQTSLHRHTGARDALREVFERELAKIIPAGHTVVGYDRDGGVLQVAPPGFKNEAIR